jgi:dienelactone hydrolase
MKRETAVIVLHEIYGINSHIRNVYQTLSEQQMDVICPNLLGRNQSFQYEQENEAS